MADEIKAPIASDDKMPPEAGLGEIVVAERGDAELLGAFALVLRDIGIG
jgi:hypothetical protein